MAQNVIMFKAESVSELREKLQAVETIGFELKEVYGFQLYGEWHSKINGELDTVFISGNDYNASDVKVGYKWLTLPVDGKPTKVKPNPDPYRGDPGWVTVKVKSQPGIWS